MFVLIWLHAHVPSLVSPQLEVVLLLLPHLVHVLLRLSLGLDAQIGWLVLLLGA